MSTLRVTGGLVHIRAGHTENRVLTVRGRVLAENPAPAQAAVSATAGDGRPWRIHAAGASVVPLLVDTVFVDSEPPVRNAFDLVPGNPATFAVIRGEVSASRIRQMLVVSPADLIAVVVDGELVARLGAPVRPRESGGPAGPDPRLGPWSDAGRSMTQHLTADGRYSETRGGRPDAYTGCFWLTGERITYLDDSGFWAFGQFHRGVLHHAGFVLHRGDLPAGARE